MIGYIRGEFLRKHADEYEANVANVESAGGCWYSR
jgi:hypothetical protein